MTQLAQSHYLTIDFLEENNELEAIQGTYRLSLKMGMGDEQKTVMYCM